MVHYVVAITPVGYAKQAVANTLGDDQYQKEIQSIKFLKPGILVKFLRGSMV